MVFELCGSEDPHLITYDFPLCLKALFLTRLDGRLEPVTDAACIGPHEFNVGLAAVCQKLQSESLQINEEHRRKHNLSPGFWFGHFAVEGHVLYLLDESGSAARDAVYKIKPSDVEPYHWEQFDSAAHAYGIYLRSKTLPSSCVALLRISAFRFFFFSETWLTKCQSRLRCTREGICKGQTRNRRNVRTS